MGITGSVTQSISKAASAAPAVMIKNDTRIVMGVPHRCAARAEMKLPKTTPAIIGIKSIQKSLGAKCMTFTHQSAAPAIKTP